MATYKVLQDIEAEDKILGPLTLRQFIYALITAALLYICFICISQKVPFLLAIFLPPAIFTGFFAFPFGRDQPTEVWAVARIRFLFKPRRRIWDQSGVKELVTITAPKKIEAPRTNGLSQNEVQSRLQALAQTIDSRGWATKNVNVNLYDSSGLVGASTSDRLIGADNMPQQVPNYDVYASDDMLDEVNNPIAQQFTHLINDTEQARRQQLIEEMNAPEPAQPAPAAPSADYWFLNQPATPAGLPASQAMFDGSQVVHPGVGVDQSGQPSADLPADDEAALSAQLKAKNIPTSQLYHSHIRTIQPLGSQASSQAVSDQMAGGQALPTAFSVPDGSQSPMAGATGNPAFVPGAQPPDPAILELASNNDLNVATLAREAYKAKNPDGPPQDEVVISLH
jgi:hypothetical protein